MNHSQAIIVFRIRQDTAQFEPWQPGYPDPIQRGQDLDWGVCVGDPSLSSSYVEASSWQAAQTLRDNINHAYNRGRADAQRDMRNALGL